MTERRRVFGEKVIELGNYSVVALIFSEIIAEKKEWTLVMIGFVLAVACWLIGLYNLGESRRKKKQWTH